MSLTTVSTSVKINANIAKNPMTPKQNIWLTNAIKDYNLNLDITTIDTVGLASNHITRIQNAINSGKLKKYTTVAPVISHTWYVVVELDELVSIKTFTGSKIEASAKARAKYGECVKFASTELDETKAKAIELRNIRTQSEVASTTTETEMTMDMLNSMDIDGLKALALTMGVNIGRSRTKNTIIARILA